MNPKHPGPERVNYAEILWRRRLVIACFFLGVLAVVAAVTLRMQPVFQSVATLMIDTEGPNVLTTSGPMELSARDYYSYKEYFASQVKIIDSEPLLRLVYQELDLGKIHALAEADDPLAALDKMIK